MSEALGMVMGSSVMPLPFFSPAQSPAGTVGPAVSVSPTTAPDCTFVLFLSLEAQAPSESVIANATTATTNRLRAVLALISAVLLVEDSLRSAGVGLVVRVCHG